MTRPGQLLACLLGVLAFAAASAADEVAEKQFQRLFGEDLRRVTATAGTRDDAELAARMLEAAQRLEALPGLRALLCQKAYELGVRNEKGYATATAAVKLLAELAPQRLAECREKLLRVYRLAFPKAKGAERPAAGKRLAEQMVLVADRKLQAGQWAEAESLYRQALGVATSLRLRLRTAILAKIRQTSAARQIHVRETYLKARLAKAPSDHQARADLIRLYVVDADRPAEAVKVLTDDLGEALRTYVPLAARPVEDVPPAACPELAAWYRGLSVKAAKAGKITVLGRAKQYYERYLSAGEPTDVVRIKVQAELKAVADELAKLVARPRVEFSMPGAVLALTFDKDTLFEKDGRTFVRDLSGRGNHGLVVGATPAEGVAGEAMEFDGRDDHVALGNPRSLQLVGDLTIAMWISPAELGARRNPFAKAYGGEGTITLEANGTVHFIWGISGADANPWQPVLLPTPVPTGEWTHLVLVRDLRRKWIGWYRNGVLAVQARASYPAARPSRAKAYLGRGYVEPFFGKMDEVAIFARALSAQHVKALYELGRQGKSLE